MGRGTLVRKSCLHSARRFQEVSRLPRRKRLETWRLAACRLRTNCVGRGWTTSVRNLSLAAVTALGTACASGRGVSPPTVITAEPPEPPSSLDSPAVTAEPPEFPSPAVSAPVALFDRQVVLATALGLRGTPYRNRGSDPDGFDCSGFIQYVFAKSGVLLPREAKEQFESGRPVERQEIEAGDLVFFTTIAPGASHVGLALDNWQFVHAPSSRGVVRVERIDTAYWSQRFIGARRLG